MIWTAGSVACAPAAPATAPAGSRLAAANVAGPPGTELVQACTPTGPELCFNAIDDNCNGVIDEGCGIETGLLQFTIAWGAVPADVNLVLVTPGRDRIPANRSRASTAGFHVDRDCPGDDGCGGQNLENIAYEGTDPPPGHYAAEIVLADLHGADPPVKVRFGARLGARTVGFDVELSPGEDEKKTFSFDLP